MISVGVSTHHISGLTLGVAESEAHIGLDMLPVLFLIDVVEVIAEENGMLLAITRTQIQEFLRIAPQIRHCTIESLRVLDHRDQAHISSCLFDGELICDDGPFIIVSWSKENVLRWILRSYVSAQ